jgi:hypothetical protein
MKQAYGDLQALYRAARRQEEPRRSDRRAVRAALLGAGAASVAVHASATGAKAIAAIPGVAKLFTAGQLVSLVGVGVALGSGVAVIGATMNSNPVPPSPSVTAPMRQNLKIPAGFAQRIEPAAEPSAPLAEALVPAVPSDSPPISGANNQASAVVHQPSVIGNQPSADGTQPTGSGRQPSAVDNQQPATLTAESRGLAEVQSALTAQKPLLALQLLSAQDNDFRNGSLGQERDAARVIALCAAGRIVDASVARERFLRAYSSSPLAKRISGVCIK